MRAVIIVILAAAILGIAYHAFAAPSPFKDIPATSTRTAQAADKPLARCVQVTTVQRFLMKPDGTMLPISGRVTLLAGC